MKASNGTHDTRKERETKDLIEKLIEILLIKEK